MLNILPHIEASDLPQRFTYPFHYEAHPLCKMAAESLQLKLQEWGWDSESYGKMFGVLIVKNKAGEIAYLWAYSGNLIPILHSQYFVPPIYDLLDSESFFAKGERELIAINNDITQIEHSEAFLKAKENLATAISQSQSEIERQRTTMASAKIKRQERRESDKLVLGTEDFEILNSQLVKESQREKSILTQLKKQWQATIKARQEQLDLIIQEINTLKAKRQNKSNILQQQLFDQYQLLNANGETKSLCDIFQESIGKQPPAGAGDCAAPRLLQYAFKNDLQALAMAEFWWGKSPKTIIRKQGHYYPSCRGKCEPILGHMLQGLDIDDNPIDEKLNKTIEIIFEDAQLLLINKPAGVLSVPGKKQQVDILHQLKKQAYNIQNLKPAHRLDMATSGLLLIAKDEKTYKNLQSQFINKQVKKRYEAILDGRLTKESGKIELPLRVDLDNRPQQQVCYDHGKPAVTIWKVIKQSNNKTRIAFFPITGRTHQLRVHAAHTDGLNIPIVGDELYGTKAQRLHLHAAAIEFIHPESGKKMKFTTTTPF